MEEHDLVEGLQKREESAVEAFLERYRSLFYHCIGHFESDPGSREDLYQDLVIYVLQRLDRGSYDPEKGSFGTWLYRVGWCRCVDLKRRQNAHRRPPMTSAAGPLPDRADESPGPIELAGQGEISSIVIGALECLEPEEQHLLRLRFMEGETLGEMATHLAIEDTSAVSSGAKPKHAEPAKQNEMKKHNKTFHYDYNGRTQNN